MASTYTTNKHIEKPASGDYNNAWAAPVNADWDDIDNSFGGWSNISVTGVGAGTYSLTLAQYQPPNIVFSGTLSANLIYALPTTAIGGLWSILNNTSGAFSLTFQSGPSGPGLLVIPQGGRTMVVVAGGFVQIAQNQVTSLPFSAITGTIANAQVPLLAVQQWEASLAFVMSQVGGTLPVSQLPADAYRNTLGSGNVTIQSGGSASGGSPGDIFLIY